MQRTHQRILAIDPGTRLMGVACLEDGKLIYHAVKVIPKGRSPKQQLQLAKDVVFRLMDDLSPQVVAIEKVFFSKSHPAAVLNLLFHEVRLAARRRRLEFAAYTPGAIKRFACGNGWAGKKQVAEAVVVRFPELKAYLTQNRLWKERFHQNMFDAVALGMLARRL